MPPLPSTLDATTKDLIETLARRERDLREFQIPRLRKFDGPLATQQQYAAEIREDLDGFGKQVEVLDAAVDDQKSERDRRELRRVVEEFRETLASLKKESRAALLASKRAIDMKGASNREELLRSSAVREKQDLNEKVAEDALMTASNNVTEALQRTIGLMQGELERSVLSSQLLEQSTASLKSASSTHDVLDGLMVTSKHLITALEKSDWLDRLLILAALLFFILVVLFILKQRIVDRGFRIMFWWTRFLPTSSRGIPYASREVVDAMEKGRLVASSVTEVVSTALVTASAVVSTVLASSASNVVAPTPSIPPEVSVASPDTVLEIFTPDEHEASPSTSILDASDSPVPILAAPARDEL